MTNYTLSATTASKLKSLLGIGPGSGGGSGIGTGERSHAYVRVTQLLSINGVYNFYAYACIVQEWDGLFWNDVEPDYYSIVYPSATDLRLVIGRRYHAMRFADDVYVGRPVFVVTEGRSPNGCGLRIDDENRIAIYPGQFAGCHLRENPYSPCILDVDARGLAGYGLTYTPHPDQDDGVTCYQLAIDTDSGGAGRSAGMEFVTGADLVANTDGTYSLELTKKNISFRQNSAGVVVGVDVFDVGKVTALALPESSVSANPFPEFTP